MIIIMEIRQFIVDYLDYLKFLMKLISYLTSKSLISSLGVTFKYKICTNSIRFTRIVLNRNMLKIYIVLKLKSN